MNDVPDYVKRWAERLVEHSRAIDLEKLMKNDASIYEQIAKIATLIGYAESAEGFYREEPK